MNTEKMVKIVYNSEPGVFGISEEGMKRYAELKGIPLYVEKNKRGVNEYWTVSPEERVGIIFDQREYRKASEDEQRLSRELYKKYTMSCFIFERTDPALVQVVEELEELAYGEHAVMQIAVLKEGTKYRIIDEESAGEFVQTEDMIAWKVA
ncbi:hypothetical protein EBT16_14915 [bacterium]|nr:hypothetical protein [bacterium]